MKSQKITYYQAGEGMGKTAFFSGGNLEEKESALKNCYNYYPFGLTFNSYKREFSKVNKMNTFQDQEYEEETGWVKFKWRNHQPELGRFFNVDPLASDYVYNSPYAFAENKLGLGIELEGLELFQQRGFSSNSFDNAMNSYSKNLTTQLGAVSKVAKGSANVTFGTVGAVGSSIYIGATEGVGAAFGGATALTLSVGQIAIGSSQIADGINDLSGGGGNLNSDLIQSSNSIPGMAAYKSGSENAGLIDAIGGAIPGMFTGGNIKNLVQSYQVITSSPNASKAAFNTLNTVGASLSVGGLWKEGTNYIQSQEKPIYKSTSSSGNSAAVESKGEKVSDEQIKEITSFIDGLQ